MKYPRHELPTWGLANARSKLFSLLVPSREEGLLARFHQDPQHQIYTRIVSANTVNNPTVLTTLHCGNNSGFRHLRLYSRDRPPLGVGCRCGVAYEKTTLAPSGRTKKPRTLCRLINPSSTSAALMPASYLLLQPSCSISTI